MVIAFYFNDILRAGPSTDSLFALIRAESKIRGLSTGKEIVGSGSCVRRPRNLSYHKLQSIDGSVELSGVRFAYPTRRNHFVANGLTLKAKKGQTIALVGMSGGGKSTVIQLLQRFYDRLEGEQGGAIRIDKQCIEDFSLHSLRSQISLVGQEPILFSGSIVENILLGVPNASMHDVQKACRIASKLD